LGGRVVHLICRDLADVEAEQKTLEEVGLFGSVVQFLCVCLKVKVVFEMSGNGFFSWFLFIAGN